MSGGECARFGRFNLVGVLARLSQLGRLAAGKSFRISGGVWKVSTTGIDIQGGQR
jgi:hypothetical protein